MQSINLRLKAMKSKINPAMSNATKLKPINSIRITIYSVLVIAVFIGGFIIIDMYLSEPEANKTFGFIYMAVTLTLIISFLKTKKSIAIPAIMMNMSVSLSSFLHMEKAMIIPNVLILVFIGYVFYYYLKHGLLKRKILELAARPVDDTQNGFTGRPYPAGKIACSKGELHGFSELLKKLVIAVPIVEENGITLSLPDDWFKRLYNTFGHYTDDTRVTIQYNGNVSVHISKYDYNKYKDELTFDQLCDSMGALFIQYFELFKNGEGDQLMGSINGNDY